MLKQKTLPASFKFFSSDSTLNKVGRNKESDPVLG